MATNRESDRDVFDMIVREIAGMLFREGSGIMEKEQLFSSIFLIL